MKHTPIFKLTIVALACMLCIPVLGCKKDKNEHKETGIILDFGNPAADGCGWVLRVGNIDYKPENLDVSFEQDSLQVKVDYNILKTRYSCGIAANVGFEYVHLNSIKRK